MARVSYGSNAGGHYNINQAPVSYNSRPPSYTLSDLKTAILADIKASSQSSVPECTTSEHSLAFSALVPLHRPNIGPYAEGGEQDLPAEFKTEWTTAQSGVKSHPQATCHAIINSGDYGARQTVQRAASRGIIAAIEGVDGFKYSFNNAWGAKDDDGLRFSYICQDSTQNKDRHANGFTRTLKHLKGEGDRGPRKPTFDCKGSISVKCSLQRQCIDVFYRHYAIHPKVKERKSAPRMSGGNLREGYKPPEGSVPMQVARQNGGEETGGLFGKLQAQNSAYVEPEAPPMVSPVVEKDTPCESNIGRPLKRKRDSDLPVQTRDSGKPLSLAELLKQSQPAKPSPKSSAPPKPSKTNAPVQPPPINYDLPSWQQAPPPHAAPVPAPQRQPSRESQPSNLPSSYQPPYNPNPPQGPQASQQQPTFHRAPSQPGPPTPAYPPASQQKYVGLPKQIPKGQGLFTTMKPVSKDGAPQGGYTYPQTAQGERRALNSCTNCRLGKKRCDERRPLCSACAKVGKYDCVYEGQQKQILYAFDQMPWQPPPPGQMQQSPVQMQPPAPMQAPAGQVDQQGDGWFGQGEPARDQSPDPWFPKR